MYGRTMSIPDALMWDWLLLLTDEPEEAIAARRGAVEAGDAHPKQIKQALARQIVTDYHGANAAGQAEGEFEKVFAGGGVPDDMPEHTLATCGLSQAIARIGLAASGREAHRLVQQGAVSIDGEKRTDPKSPLEPRDAPYVVKVGKRRFARVTVEAS